MEQKKYRIFILGAGFSASAGFPLARDLWSEILKRANSLTGRAGKFQADLENYLRYRRGCDGKEISADQVDYEDLMGFLDVEHFLRLRGSDTWSPDGNESTVVVKTLIGEILAEQTPSTNDVPELYRRFADKLLPDDIVLTFNYDVLLERALEAAGKPYRLFPNRYESVQKHLSIVDSSKEEVSILKLHGSMDWFDRTSYSDWEKQRGDAGLSGSPDDPVFHSAKELGVTKLLDGPRHPDDPLSQMYRVRDIEALYKKNIMFLATPWLLTPSTMKILYAGKLREFWHGLGNAGVWNFGLVIIGYSLPPQDEYARQAVYRLVTNYQENDWNKEVLGQKKSPLVIVDNCRNGDQLKRFKERYRFVDWDRAMLYTEGFNDKSIELIFDEM